MLIIENKQFKVQIKYAFDQLIKISGVVRNKSCSRLVYYGKKKPKNFTGIHVHESDFWCNYMKKSSVPNRVHKSDDIVVLFGDESKPDIIAGTFFMLTRYEELFIHNLDDLGRVPARESLAFKYGFMDRAVVNEYAAILKNQLTARFPENFSVKNRRAEYFFTHDVDKLYKTRWTAIKTEIKNLLRLRLLALPGIFYHIFNHKNPADTFEWLNKIEKNRGFYYFMPKSEDGHDTNSSEIKKLAERLQTAGAALGIHPESVMFSNFKTFKNILDRFSLPKRDSRTHFLAFDVRKSWDYLAQAKIRTDSTLAYADQLGFRAGTCSPYQVFSLTQGKPLSLIELPLTIMDVTLFGYLRLSPGKAWLEFKKYFQIIAKHKGLMVILWHNFALDELRWRRFYKRVVEYLNNAKWDYFQILNLEKK